MSIYRRKDSSVYWARFTVNGKRIQVSTGTDDRQAAQEYHDRLKASLWRQSKLGDKPRKVWQEAVVRWCDEKRHKKSLRDDVAKFRWLDPLFKNRALDELTRDFIGEVIARKLAGSSPATANRYVALIRAVLRAAERDWGWIESAPRLRTYREQARRVRWLTPEQARDLLAALPQHQRDVVTFALATGLRQGNVLGLRWSQVDLDRGVAWVEADEAKGGEAIGVPLSNAALEVLRRQRGQHPDRVFTYRGKPIGQANTRAWRAALARVGIEGFRWHDLRHAWATWHAMAGTPAHELQELGGWRSASMVRRYAHFMPEHLRRSSERVGTILDTALSEDG